MFLSNEVKMSYNVDKLGYELNEKLSYESKSLKPDVPTLKEIGIHPYRWIRLTVPEGFIYKPESMSLSFILNNLIDSDTYRKSFLVYDYLNWKIRVYKHEKHVYNNDSSVKSVKQVADNLFLDMIEIESSKYPISSWKWKLIKFFVRNFNAGMLIPRADDMKRIS
jgi:hypothetical protein